MIYRFDDFELDLEKYELREAGAARHVEPMVFDLLRFLSENPDRVVSRDEIIDAVWGGRIVSDATVSSCIKSARKALGDSGDNQRYIRTIRGRGVQFTAAVTGSGASGPPAPAVPQDTAEKVAAGTSLAILPFDVFSSDQVLEYFADGLVEDLTTILARVPSLTVISRSSSFAYKGRSPTVTQVRDDLGVSHLIEGSVRALGEMVRINVQLIDTADRSHVWADRFDRPRDELVHLPDDIIQSISRVLEPQLVRVSYVRGQHISPEADVVNAFNQATSLLSIKGWHQDSFTEADALMDKCIAIEPEFARAHAFKSLVLGLGQRVGFITDLATYKPEAIAAAERALALDDLDSMVLGYAGCALADVGEQKRGIPILEKAVEQDPSNAQAWVALGAAKLADRRPDEGVPDLREGIRLSPLDNRLAVWLNFLAAALLHSGDTEGALKEIQSACRQDLRNFMSRVTLAAIHLAGGRPDAAKEAMAEAYKIRPELSEYEIEAIVGRRALAEMQRLDLLAA